MVLFIQYRTDQSGWHELKCYFQTTGLKYNEMQAINVNSDSVTTEDIRSLAKKAEAIFISGFGESGYEAYESDDQEKIKDIDNIRAKMKPLLEEWVKEDKPVLAICFGHQMLSESLGQEVKVDKSQSETGIAQIQKTEAAAKDPLFKDLSEEFSAIQGHKASVMGLPEGAVQLARSEKCEFQAYRLGENVYSVQFHPELDLKELEYRLTLYPGYKENKLDFDENQKLEAVEIIQKFVKRYVG